MANVIEVWVDKERFNSRVNATIPGAWVATIEEDGMYHDIAIGREHEFKSKADAMKVAVERFC